MADGTLPSETDRVARAHLGGCVPCQNFFAGMNGVGAAVKTVVRREPSTVSPALLSAFEGWVSLPERRATSIPGRVAGYGVAAAAFVLSLVLAFAPSPNSGTGAMSFGRSLLCSGVHLAGALLPAALVFALGATRFVGRAPGLVGSAAAAGAIFVQIIDQCPASTSLQHELVFHTGAVFLAVASAVSVTRLWAAARVRNG